MHSHMKSCFLAKIRCPFKVSVRQNVIHKIPWQTSKEWGSEQSYLQRTNPESQARNDSFQHIHTHI